MFLSSKNYLEQFSCLVKKSENLSLAVAFWGRGAETLIEKAWTGKTLRILCNLGCGGTNPYVIRNLLKLQNTKPGLHILLLDDLHAKVAISETTAIVGSANVSANGLGFEGSECIGWQEAGILLNDTVQVAELQEWFDQLWARGQEVTEERLLAAEQQWCKNRSSRPIDAEKFRDATLTTLRDRDIYVAIYRDQLASVQAEAETDEVRKEARQLGLQGINPDALDFYEDWPDDSEEPLPKNKPFISVYYGPRKRVEVNGVWKRVPQLDRSFDSIDTGEKIQLTIVEPQEQLGELKFSKADYKELAERFRPWINDLFSETEAGYARCVHFNKFIDWKDEQSPTE